MGQDSPTHPCPADLIHGEGDCGRSFGSENGAVMHSLNKGDEYHDVVAKKPDAYDALADAEGVPTPDARQESSGQETSDVEETTESDETSPLKATMPDSAEDDEAECPGCGAGLGMTEDEALAFIEKHGEAWCEDCGARLTADGGEGE